MNVAVCAQPARRQEAESFIRRLGALPVTFSLVKSLGSLRGLDKCLLYLGGDEDAPILRARLKELARKSSLQMVVLYSAAPSLDQAVEWGRLVERYGRKRGEVCFDATAVADALDLPGPAPSLEVEVKRGRQPDVRRLRESLGLTQKDLARAAGVATRTIQYWERSPSPKAARRLRDLIELHNTLADYLDAEQIVPWLSAPNRICLGASPRDWLLDGRARDVLLEIRRLQTGEPL